MFKKYPQVKILRYNNAKEYVSDKLMNSDTKAGVKVDPASPYAPQVNGMTKRANRTLLGKRQAVLYDAKLSKQNWEYGIMTAYTIESK